MTRKFLTLELIIMDSGEERVLVKMLDNEVKERVFHAIEEAIKFLEGYLTEARKKEVSK